MTEEYRQLVRMTLDSQKHFTFLITHNRHDQDSYHVRRGTWLHLVGLIETWDMVVWTQYDQDHNK